MPVCVCDFFLAFFMDFGALRSGFQLQGHGGISCALEAPSATCSAVQLRTKSPIVAPVQTCPELFSSLVSVTWAGLHHTLSTEGSERLAQGLLCRIEPQIQERP